MIQVIYIHMFVFKIFNNCLIFFGPFEININKILINKLKNNLKKLYLLFNFFV